MHKSALLLRSATPVKDDECQRLIGDLSLKEYVSNFEANLDIGAYYNEFVNWLKHSERIHFPLNPFFTPYMSSGITEGFNDFYLRNKDRNLFILRGEYPYHKDVYEALALPPFYIDETPLNANAFVIMSVPFSASGALHPRTFEVLETCSLLNVPVFIDFAFLGLGSELDMEDFLQYSCVSMFAFSFSKLFSLGRVKAGWTWSREEAGFLPILNRWKYTNWLGHYVARECIRHFPFDYMYKKYQPIQHKLCRELHLQPSQSYLFGIGDDQFNSFSRQGTWNRVCLSTLMEQEIQNNTPLDSSHKFTIG